MINLRIKNEEILNFIIIILVAFGILAPIASNDFMPTITDFASHSGLISQAKKTLFTGDFPIRIAPWQHNGYQYPEFQFYSPTPFTIAALVYGLFFSFNVYLALKVMYWLILVFAGIYTYRLGALMTRSKEIAILMSVSYMVSPYFLINILSRSAFTEAFAQAVIPYCLFYTFKFFKDDMPVKNLLCVALGWFLLATSHLITYINFSSFMFLLLVGMYLVKLVSFKKIIGYGLSYLYSILLFAWFIVPILIFHQKLNINHDISKIMDSNWLTPISELFSFQSVSMMPLPGNGRLESEIYPSLGWIFIMSFIGLWYGLSKQAENQINLNKKLAYILMFLFCLAIILTWSPINFWKFLPIFFQVSQFSYRFLTQTMWIGSLLLGLFLSIHIKEKNIFYVFIGVLFILNLNGSWIHSLVSRDLSPRSIANSPDIGYGAFDYLYDTKHSSIQLSNISLPLKYSDGWLILGKSIELDGKFLLNNPHLNLHIEGSNALKHPTNIRIYLDDKVIHQMMLPVGHFNLMLPMNLQNFENRLTHQMKLITSEYFIPKEKSANPRHLSLKIDSISFKNAAYEYSAMRAEEVQKNCYLKKMNHQILCELKTPQNISVLQLPFLFYPKMLSIYLDGKSIGENYFSSTCGQYQCVAINIKPGKHHLAYQFIGIHWANIVSYISWVFFVLFLLKNRLISQLITRFYLKGF